MAGNDAVDLDKPGAVPKPAVNKAPRFSRNPLASLMGIPRPAPMPSLFSGRAQQDDDDDADDITNGEQDDEENENEDPSQDGEGSLQDGPEGEGEQDPAQDGQGSLQDGDDDQAEDLGEGGDKKKKGKDGKDGKDKDNDKKSGGGAKGAASGAKGGKAGPMGKLKDPWDPEVTMEIAKQAGGIPPFPVPYPCPECKKLSLYLDKWIMNGARLTIFLAYCIIVKGVNLRDMTQQVHFLCLNAKCKKFAFNSFKYKFAVEVSSGKMAPRQFLFASPFPKMTVKEAEKIRQKVSNKNKK